MRSICLKKIFFFSILFFINSCGDIKMESSNKFDAIENYSEHFWDKLSMTRVFFGHQSVGNNIIDGISELLNKNPMIKITIKRTNEAKDFTKPVLGHYEIGENRNITAKIKDFENYMENGIGEIADIALMKLCYVDFSDKTDTEEVFNIYLATIFRLKEKYPRLKIIHVTTPLTASPNFFEKSKNFIKLILGRPTASVNDNIFREKYNNILREKFGDEGSLFDLAYFEAKYSNGERSFFEYEGKHYAKMVRDYTDDGGHLNKNGSKIIAEQLLIFLGKLLN